MLLGLKPFVLVKGTAKLLYAVLNFTIVYKSPVPMLRPRNLRLDKALPEPKLEMFYAMLGAKFE